MLKEENGNYTFNFGLLIDLLCSFIGYCLKSLFNFKKIWAKLRPKKNYNVSLSLKMREKLFLQIY